MTRPAALTALLVRLVAQVAAESSAEALERAPPELPIPTRPLEWGDVNFLHTSDTHGWLLGHQHNTWPEPNYSGDFGSWASFATHMRAQADEKGVDMLLVDSGDHHDGTGLVSTSPESAARTDEIFGKLEYDVLALGNHELYQYPSARWIYDNRRRWNGRFLTSNVNITVEENGEAVSVPIADRYAKFDTKQGRKVTAFGVIFDFKAHAKNLTIQSPTKMAYEPWFLDAIKDTPDLFVLAGHMPARGETSEWAPVFAAIRAVHPRVPIFVFGGHTHVRDCTQYDTRSIAIVPGRYLESIAFVSSSMPSSKDDTSALTMNRRYLDANPVSYQWHTDTTTSTFDTGLGQDITRSLKHMAAELNLSTPLGKVPHDYFLSRHPYYHPRSIISFFGNKVLPRALQDPRRRGPRLIVGNAGSLRFDVFKGTFDRNDELTVSPFTSAFLYTRLPAGVAHNITIEMNRAGASKLQPLSPSEDDDAYVHKVYSDWLADQWERYEAEQLASSDAQVAFTASKPRTLGYVTHDACPGKGDDIEHIPVPFSRQQIDFVVSPMPDVGPDDEIDMVVMDFAMDDFLTAASVIDPERKLQLDDFTPYAKHVLVNSLFSKYAKLEW